MEAAKAHRHEWPHHPHPAPRLTSTAARSLVVLAAVTRPLTVRVAVAASAVGTGGPAGVVPARAAAVPAATQHVASSQQPPPAQQQPLHAAAVPGCPLGGWGGRAAPHRPSAGRGDQEPFVLLQCPGAWLCAHPHPNHLAELSWVTNAEGARCEELEEPF